MSVAGVKQTFSEKRKSAKGQSETSAVNGKVAVSTPKGDIGRWEKGLAFEFGLQKGLSPGWVETPGGSGRSVKPGQAAKPGFGCKMGTRVGRNRGPHLDAAGDGTP